MISRIPICPSVLEQECLSSWIERTACFYGCTLERWIGQFSAELENDSDIDLSEGLRSSLSKWTGIPLDAIPKVSNSLRTLPNFARLSFCETCWDEDVREGNQPYVRRHWLNWNIVHCTRHRSFLSAKNRTVDQRATRTAWQEVWASKPNWRSALQLRAHGYALWTLCYRMSRQAATCDERLMDLLERFTNKADHAAYEALNDVLQTWRRPAFATTMPLLLENRIEILSQAASIVGQSHGGGAYLR